MAKKTWVWNPHAGGVKIPPQVQQRTEQRIRTHAESYYAGRFTRLDVRFRGALCYIDAYTEPEDPSPSLLRSLGETRKQYMDRLRNAPIHLCRLRYFTDDDAWSMAFYTYSHERYEPCCFEDGSLHGTPEAAFDIGAVYLPEASPHSPGGTATKRVPN